MFGGCCDPCKNQSNAGLSHIHEYDNTTKVADWHCEPGADIAPYTRPNPAPDPCSGGAPDCTCDHPKCGPWPLDERVANVFVEVDLFANLSRCFNFGFKNVQALNSWHGRFGYTYPDFVRAPVSGIDGSCYSCSVECEHTGVPDTKYCQIDVTATFTNFGVVSSSTRSFKVDKHSGIRSISGTCSDTGGGFVGVNKGDWDLTDIVNLYLSVGSPAGSAATETVSDCSLTRDIEWVSNNEPLNGVPDGVIMREAHLNVGAGSLLIKYYNYLGPDNPVVEQVTVDFTDTTLHYVDSTFNASDGTEETRVEVSSTLSDEYTWNTVWTELVQLASYIALNDDALYQWRTDAFTSIAPQVSYNEPRVARKPSATFGDCTYVDPDIAAFGYDGTVKGVLDNRALKDGFFDYDAITFKTCTNEAGCQWDKDGDGDWSGNSVVPRTATQWTNKRDACGLFHAAFVAMAGTQGVFAQAAGSSIPTGFAYPSGVVVLQKWAEIKTPIHRLNQSRPCGADKFILTDVRCVTEVSGGTITLNAAPDSPYSTVGLSDVAGFTDGIYSVSSSSGASLTPGSLLEAGTFSGYGSGIVGEVKFPSAGDCDGDFYLPSAGKVAHCEWQHDLRDYQERDRFNAEVAFCSCSGLSPGAAIRPIELGMPRSVKSFSQWQHLVGYNACYPTVLAITPNGESWVGGVTVDFSTSPLPAAADSRYGSLWQAEFVQMVSDPYWEVPKECDGLDRPVPVDVDCPPVVETDVTQTPPLGWLLVEEIQAGASGNVLPPPDLAGPDFGCTPNPKATAGLPWVRYLAGCTDTGKDAWTAP